MRHEPKNLTSVVCDSFGFIVKNSSKILLFLSPMWSNIIYCIAIRSSKGKKDRFTLLSPDTLELLRFYIRAYRPKGGLIFNGKYKGRPWSEKGAQYVTVLARRKAKLIEFVTAHTLRHCFATHPTFTPKWHRFGHHSTVNGT